MEASTTAEGPRPAWFCPQAAGFNSWMSRISREGQVRAFERSGANSSGEWWRNATQPRYSTRSKDSRSLRGRAPIGPDQRVTFSVIGTDCFKRLDPTALGEVPVITTE